MVSIFITFILMAQHGPLSSNRILVIPRLSGLYSRPFILHPQFCVCSGWKIRSLEHLLPPQSWCRNFGPSLAFSVHISKMIFVSRCKILKNIHKEASKTTMPKNLSSSSSLRKTMISSRFLFYWQLVTDHSGTSRCNLKAILKSSVFSRQVNTKSFSSLLILLRSV